MKFYFTTLLCMSAFFIVSCSSNDPSSQNMKFRDLDLSEFPDLEVVDDKNEDLYLVINSKEEFDELIDLGTEQEAPFDIDFQTETLLIGKVRLTGIHGQLVEQNLQQCDDSIVQYDLTVMNGGYTAIGKFLFGIVTSKVNASQVSFNIDTVEYQR